MITVVGTVALDTLARVRNIAAPETTAGVLAVRPEVPGGTAGNVAMALARLGAPPHLVSCVGEEFAETDYARQLDAAGVDLTGLVRTKEPTSRAYIFYDGAGAQCTYFYPGASKALAQATSPLQGRVHFAAGEISVYPRLMERAGWVSFDPGQETFHRGFSEIEACLPHVDILFLNRHELECFTLEHGLDVAALHKLGVTTIVETRGGDGGLVHQKDQAPVHAPAVEARMQDPTGAGDAHRAGYLYALERGAPPLACARFANVMGAFAIETVGAQEGLPTLAQALARYERAFGDAPF